MSASARSCSAHTHTHTHTHTPTQGGQVETSVQACSSMRAARGARGSCSERGVKRQRERGSLISSLQSCWSQPSVPSNQHSTPPITLVVLRPVMADNASSEPVAIDVGPSMENNAAHKNEMTSNKPIVLHPVMDNAASVFVDVASVSVDAASVPAEVPSVFVNAGPSMENNAAQKKETSISEKTSNMIDSAPASVSVDAASVSVDAASVSVDAASVFVNAGPSMNESAVNESSNRVPSKRRLQVATMSTAGRLKKIRRKPRRLQASLPPRPYIMAAAPPIVLRPVIDDADSSEPARPSVENDAAHSFTGERDSKRFKQDCD